MTNNEAELWALFQGLRIAVRNGYSSLEIEGDSQITIDMLKKLRNGKRWDQVTYSWRTAGIIHDIEGLLRRIEYTIINHVMRSGNRAADLLANWGSGGSDRTVDRSWTSLNEDPRWKELNHILSQDHNDAITPAGDN